MWRMGVRGTRGGGWDAEPGASGSGSDGDDGLEFLG